MTVTASKFKRKKNDLYPTEAWAVEALLRCLPLKGVSVWEPAAGEHAIAEVLTQNGANVLTSDICTYRRCHNFEADFLSFDSWPAGYVPTSFTSAIVTNPPYGIQNRTAVAFCETALKICPGIVAMLLTMKFDSGSTRKHLFRDNPRFSAKIVLTDRISFEGNGKGGTEDHAWYIWTRERINGAPRIYYEGRK